MRAIAQFFDFLANGADLFFGRLRLHDNQHGKYLKALEFIVSSRLQQISPAMQ